MSVEDENYYDDDEFVEDGAETQTSVSDDDWSDDEFVEDDSTDSGDAFASSGENDDFTEDSAFSSSDDDFVASEDDDFVPDAVQPESVDDDFVPDDSEDLMSSALAGEYDATFSGEEKTAAALKLTSEAFSRTFQRIRLSEIIIPEALKSGRSDTLTGLSTLAKDLGILVPIHVKELPEESQDEECKYVLLDGLRRMFGAMKNGQTEIDAIVWNFTDDDVGSEYATFISMLLNRSQRRTWRERWDLLQILELQSSVTPGTLEFLLDMEPGEAMKLKDVMLCNYDDVKEALLTGQKTLDAAYKMLAKYRKEENMLEIADKQGVDDTVDGAAVMASNNVGDNGTLTDEDVMELLDMSSKLDISDDADDVDFKELNTPLNAEQQKVGDRHPLDPQLRQAVLSRDEFTCACCGTKLIGARLGTIAVHHKIPVHCGGKDLMENLITLCVSCHIALHTMEIQGGSILMSEEDWNAQYEKDEDGNILEIDGKPVMSPSQISLLKARKLALVAIEAEKRKGMSRDAVREASADALKHPMPKTAFNQGKSDYVAAESA